MSQSLVFLLLSLALVLPVLGAAALRMLAARLDARQFFGTAALLFGIAIVSVLLLSRGNIESLRIGNLTLLLPLGAPSIDELNLPPEIDDLIDQTPVLTDTVQPTLESSPVLSVTATLVATALPTATLTLPWTSLGFWLPMTMASPCTGFLLNCVSTSKVWRTAVSSRKAPAGGLVE